MSPVKCDIRGCVGASCRRVVLTHADGTREGFDFCGRHLAFAHAAVHADVPAASLIARLARELESMNERHGCGQVECAHAMDAVADARRFLGLRRREDFPT